MTPSRTIGSRIPGATGLLTRAPDPEAHLAAIGEFAAAGYDHVYVHQVGPDQDGFLDFYAREILA